MIYFNTNGRRACNGEFRVFSDIPKNYYQLKQPEIDYSKILENSIKFGGVSSAINLDRFQFTCEKLKKEIKSNPDFKNLFNAVHIPFICKKVDSANDLGRDLEEIELPGIQRSFKSLFPKSHFKAVLQSNSQLPGSITLDPRSRYKSFLEKSLIGNIVGWYFPQALQEFDIESQRKQMKYLPEHENICLSGGIDIAAAIIGSPELLISDNFYTPILCMSAYVHSDSRLVLLLKSYGPHMEFWCMTQMLSKNITQVSEQWAGGITAYSLLS